MRCRVTAQSLLSVIEANVSHSCADAHCDAQLFLSRSEGSRSAAGMWGWTTPPCSSGPSSDHPDFSVLSCRLTSIVYQSSLRSPDLLQVSSSREIFLPQGSVGCLLVVQSASRCSRLFFLHFSQIKVGWLKSLLEFPYIIVWTLTKTLSKCISSSPPRWIQCFYDGQPAVLH